MYACPIPLLSAHAHFLCGVILYCFSVVFISTHMLSQNAHAVTLTNTDTRADVYAHSHAHAHTSLASHAPLMHLATFLFTWLLFICSLPFVIISLILLHFSSCFLSPSSPPLLAFPLLVALLFVLFTLLSSLSCRRICPCLHATCKWVYGEWCSV